MSLWLDSRLLHGKRQGGSGEIAPREVDVHATVCGSLREEETN